MGLATAWHASRRTGTTVRLLEQFALGHNNGSSHGRVRIARSTYPDSGYVRLMTRARKSAWKSLEEELGHSLIRPVPGCIFGPKGGLVDTYQAGVADGGVSVNCLNKKNARTLFPSLALDNQMVLSDPTVGLINAQATCDGLRSLALANGVCIVSNTHVVALESTADCIKVRTGTTTYCAERVVVAAGSWTGKLVPELCSRLMVHRQDVGYFVACDGTTHPVGDLAWIYLGHSNNDVYYGLTDRADTLKAAHHRRSGPTDKPDDMSTNSQKALQQLDSFVHHNFHAKLTRQEADTCLYTSTKSDDFILDTHPADPRIVVGAGFSGHGFKFAPLIGQILDELSATGDCRMEEFQEMIQQLSFDGPT
jgi:monomeric sarcosine oxidase